MIKKRSKKKEKIKASLFLSLVLVAKDKHFSITELSLKIIQKNKTRLLCFLPSLQNI